MRLPERCEVTRALVMVRRFTGTIEPNSKFVDTESEDVKRAIGEAEEAFEKSGEVFTPVVVL